MLTIIATNSCGRKGALVFEGEQKRPKFDGVYDEK